MKNFNFAKYIALSVFSLLFFTACKKDYVEPLGDKGQKIIGFINGGKSAGAFKASSLDLDLASPKDSIQLRLLYSTPQVSDRDITVTVFNDPAKLAAFNAAQPAGDTIFQALADSQYLIKTPQVKIRAGQTLSEPFYVIFYPNKLRTDRSYMISLGISKIDGAPADVKAASGTGTAYIHYTALPPNPLRGNYSVVGTRYNYLGSVTFDGNPANIPTPTGTPPTVAIPSPKVANAINGDKVDIDFSNLGSATSFNFRYEITQLNNFANISVSYNTDFTSGNSSIRTFLISYTPPGPSVKAKFRIITQYNNAAAGGGNDRIIDESFTQL